MMKVLVYGAGAIGCHLTHVLCDAGNEVTLPARGKWKEQLRENGLRIPDFRRSLFVPVVSGWTPLPRWACVFNILPLMLVLMPTRVGGSGNWAGAIMFLGLIFLL